MGIIEQALTAILSYHDHGAKAVSIGAPKERDRNQNGKEKEQSILSLLLSSSISLMIG